MLVKRYPILGSSQNPEQVKMRIKSVGIVLIPALMFVLGLFGYDIGQEQWQNLLEYTINGVGAILVLYSVVLQVWGWIRAFKK